MIASILISFFAMAALDFVFAFYTRHVMKTNAAKAGMYASLIVITNALVTLNYVADPWMIVPTVVGAFAGTWLAVRLHL